MSHFQILTYEVQTLLGVALLLVLSGLMFRKRLHRELPLFFCYILLECAVGLLGFHLLRGDYLRWWWFSWIENTASIICFLGILAEIFFRIFSPYKGIRRIARAAMLFCSVALIPLGVAFGTSAHPTNLKGVPSSPGFTTLSNPKALPLPNNRRSQKNWNNGTLRCLGSLGTLHHPRFRPVVSEFMKFVTNLEQTL
jgi:hypothetical protein